MTEILKNMYTRLYEIGKIMKVKDNDYLYIDMNTRIITSVDTITFKYIFMDTDLYDKLHVVEMNGYKINNTIYSQKMLKNMIADDFSSEYDNIFIPNIGVVEGGVNDVSIYNGYSALKRIQNLIFQHYNQTSNVNIEHSYIFRDIHNDTKFISILELKSADGAIPYIINQNHIVLLFNGLLPILKSDKVHVEINDLLGVNDFFEARFIIDKKKYTVNVSMNCLYI